ncbi:glycosyltransferase [Lentibacillus salinarum]|uniref:Glycosyltransferase n=1 Tax=Lentibacillus salinarum TaxID=446820 RepID=A0ABW4A0R5_9BACI
MQKITPIILSNSIDIVRGGLTKAMFTRANTLARKFNKVVILTFSFQQNHKEIIEEIYNKGLLNRNIEVHNMFVDLNSHKERHKKSEVNKSANEKGFIVFKDEKQKTNSSYRYYKNGFYVKYKRFDQQGNVLFIDYMNEGRHRTRREEYNKQGYLVRTRHMDITINKPSIDRYFDNKGKCYATIWIDPKTGKTGRVNVFDKTPKEFKSMESLKKSWVEKKIKKIKTPVIMTDKRDMDKLALKLGHNNLKRVAVVHNNHFKKPFDNTAEIKKNYMTLFDNLNHFDKVVFLTEEQKEDVEHLFGNDNNNLTVIPHPAKHVTHDVRKEVEYNPYKAVTLARYVEQKRLDEAIEAFKFVVEKIPSAEYYIYGFGKKKDNLQQLIKRLRLQDNVKLKEFALDASAIYKSAACSILTSDYEGFGMVLTESLSAGTPVVTYNSKYGPSDIVRDEVDGFVVPKGNKEELANKIVKIMENKDLRKKLSIKALDVKTRFSLEDYTKRWNELISSI